MTLKRKKISLKEEQKIITNMITSTDFLKQVKGVVHSYLLKSTYARIISTWVWEYYESTGTAPGRDIQDLYVRKRKALEDEEEVELISEFLQNLSDNWQASQAHSISYEVTNTIKYMKLRQLEQLQEQIATAVQEGNPEQGESYLSGYKKIREVQSSGTTLLSDADEIREAFESVDEVLFTLQGDLGKVVGPLLRGDFLALLGGPKSTKSFSMWYIAHRAMLMGLNVFIANFEMSKNQYNRRAWQSLLGLPRYKSKVSIPYFEEDENGEDFYVEYREEVKPGISTLEIEKEQETIKRYTKGANIKIMTYMSKVSTLSDVLVDIENAEYYEGFVPDVIIFDYADIIAPETKGETRHQIDNIWTRIRGLAVEKNCLCVTASQVNAGAWGKDIKGKDADENKKKAGHVTKMLAINTTEEEFNKGILRVESLYQREGKRVIQQAIVLFCLDIGRWYLDSKFKNKVIFDD